MVTLSLSSHDLQYPLFQQNKIQQDVCQTLVDQICRRITYFNKLGHTQCTFHIPTLMIGFPVYNVNEVVIFLIYFFRKNGYLVKYLGSRKLWLDWTKQTLTAPVPAPLTSPVTLDPFKELEEKVKCLSFVKRKKR